MILSWFQFSVRVAVFVIRPGPFLRRGSFLDQCLLGTILVTVDNRYQQFPLELPSAEEISPIFTADSWILCSVMCVLIRKMKRHSPPWYCGGRYLSTQSHERGEHILIICSSFRFTDPLKVEKWKDIFYNGSLHRCFWVSARLLRLLRFQALLSQSQPRYVCLLDLVHNPHPEQVPFSITLREQQWEVRRQTSSTLIHSGEGYSCQHSKYHTGTNRCGIWVSVLWLSEKHLWLV